MDCDRTGCNRMAAIIIHLGINSQAIGSNLLKQVQETIWRLQQVGVTETSLQSVLTDLSR
jgi:hypothetical protein